MDKKVLIIGQAGFMMNAIVNGIKKAEYEDMTDKLNALANKISAYKSLWDGISRAGTFRENLRRELMMEEGIMYNRTANNYK